MFKKILCKIFGIFLIIPLKCINHLQYHIEQYLPSIKRHLGFNFVVKLLTLFPNNSTIECILRNCGATIGGNARIYSPLIIQNAIGSFENLIVGNNCHIGRDSFLDLANKITIGDNVTISMRSTIITHLDVGDSQLRQLGYPRQDGDVNIGDNVYLGCGVTILHGVSIGENTLVGAGAIVTNDIPSKSIAVGIPARVIRKIDEKS